MVTGTLRRNKKMRKKGKNVEDKVKILSGEEIRFDKIKSMLDSGCSVILHNILENKNGLAYESAREKNGNIIWVVLKPEEPNYFEDSKLRFSNGNNYEIVSGRGFEIKPTYHPMYKELNEKANRLL